MKPALVFLLCFVAALPCLAQNRTGDEDEAGSSLSDFGLKGYGIFNYYHYDWDTYPQKRDAVDLERFSLYPSYKYSDKLSFRGEIEFEHGGTGATKEFDVFEESGEYETEIEKGGEVNIEQLYILYHHNDAFNLKLGKVKLPVGIAAVKDDPTEYFTTSVSPAEATVIPVGWYEIGVQALGSVGRIGYTLSFVNGLDGTGFSSANWIAPGHQGRFEMVNANNFAGSLRLDYHPDDDIVIGFSGYMGNSTGNRPKPNLTLPAWVGIVEGHFMLEDGPWNIRALALYGHLQNSAAVSQANRNISSNLQVKRDPVGKAALAWYAEAAYDLSRYIPSVTTPIDLFGRYEFYDSMYRVVKGVISDNPRWERHAVTGGVDVYLNKRIVLKSQFMHRWLGFSGANVENTFSVGLGFEF